MADNAIPKVMLFMPPSRFAKDAAVPFERAIAKLDTKKRAPSPAEATPNFWFT